MPSQEKCEALLNLPRILDRVLGLWNGPQA